jgi:hypothetical protein
MCSISLIAECIEWMWLSSINHPTLSQ